MGLLRQYNRYKQACIVRGTFLIDEMVKVVSCDFLPLLGASASRNRTRFLFPLYISS